VVDQAAVDRLLDPEIAEAVRAFPLDLGNLSLELLQAMRGQALPPFPGSDAVERRVLQIPGWEGDPDVTVHVHRPTVAAADGPLPCLVWMHGGGYVFGSAELDDARFDRWVPLLGCVGVSVEYRHAPETPYPGPLHDCYAALTWVHAHAGELGVDPARVGTGGQSAGGGLAAALALLARDRGEVSVAFQCLVYPMIDDRLENPCHHWPVPIWPPGANRFGWASYLGDLAGGDVPVYAAPARADDLAGLPPALVVVGGLDGFVEEDVDYALRLNRAGVPTELHVYPGACHGFEGIAPDAVVSQQAKHDVDTWLARVMHP
jgi:acetyl esterase/lipase